MMNLVWYVTAGAHATRLDAAVRGVERAQRPVPEGASHGEVDRGQFLEEVRHFIGLADAPQRELRGRVVGGQAFGARIEAPSLSGDDQTVHDTSL